VRPGADPLFRSIARAWGPSGTAVVLSGALDDGAAGAVTVAQAGGTVLVQDPEDALVPGMPSAAIAATTPDAVLPIDALAERLATAIATPQPQEALMATEPDPAEMLQGPNRPEGPASGFTCPECNGAIWELKEGDLTRYRCRVGHAYSEEAMVDAQGAAVEAALWTALEVLEERTELLRRVAARSSTHPRTRSRFESGARETAARAAIIRSVLAADHEPAA
jgi:two-component system chemotaxis response regulator CheB